MSEIFGSVSASVLWVLRSFDRKNIEAEPEHSLIKVHKMLAGLAIENLCKGHLAGDLVERVPREFRGGGVILVLFFTKRSSHLRNGISMLVESERFWKNYAHMLEPGIPTVA
jgi:hypothetical protein